MAKKTSVKTMRVNATRSNNARKNRFGARNNRERKMIYTIAALAVALVATIGVAVAAFSTELHIHGSGVVSSTVWDIHFANLQPVFTQGAGAKEVTTPSIKTSTAGTPLAAIMDYKVQLKEPGDYIEYTFDVENGGDMDAELSAMIINTGSDLTCTTLSTTAGTADRVCAKLNYTLTYADGTPVAIGDELLAAANGTNTKTMKLKLEFDPSATSADLPDKDVEVGNLAVSLTYSQK